MISAVCWVPKGASKPVLTEAEDRSKEEIEEFLKSVIGDNSEDEEDNNTMDIETSKQDEEDLATLCKSLKRSKLGTETDELMHLMHNYAEEDNGVGLFGSSNLYYPSNKMDPNMNGDDDDDSYDEDDIIKPDDSVIVCAGNKDDGQLEVSILQDFIGTDSSMYVHHHFDIPAFPLCTAWLDCLKDEKKRGNFIAVGSMEPAIEIWDLDIRDAVQPSAVLGGIIEKKKKFIKYKDGSHTDSVLGLAWNKKYRNVLASASADKLVKIWDVTTEKCEGTMENHTDKVAWNHFASKVLLSGSFDKSVVMKDVRSPSSIGFRWEVAAEVESLAWDPHTAHSFVVSLENGMVSGFDIRSASSNLSSQSKPSFTIHAHEKAVCTISYYSAIPNLLATGSKDKTVKIWDLSNQPSCIASTNPKAGAVFSISFSEDRPFSLAIGGSKGKLRVWDLLSDAGIAARYGKYANKDKPPPS